MRKILSAMMAIGIILVVHTAQANSMCEYQIYNELNGSIFNHYYDQDCSKAANYCQQATYNESRIYDPDTGILASSCKTPAEKIKSANAYQKLYFKGKLIQTFFAVRFSVLFPEDLARDAVESKCRKEQQRRKAADANPSDWDAYSQCAE